MNRKEMLLTILGEEASEVVKEVSKCLRFSVHCTDVKHPISPGERLLAEFDELVAVKQMLQAENVLPRDCPTRRAERIRAKKAKVEEMLALSEKLGTLQKEKGCSHVCDGCGSEVLHL